MDVEAVVWLLVMLVWFVSGVIKQIRGMGTNPPVEAPPPVEVSPVDVVPQSEGRSREAVPPVPVARPSRPAPPKPTPQPTDPLQELFRQLGVEVVPEPSQQEQPVASEHRRTASEHQRTASEHRQTASEVRRTASEHRQTASEARRTASEHRRVAGEHRLTASEHLPGDVKKVIKRTGPAKVKRRRSGLARSVRHELRTNLAKAFLMREILGPAPGLGPTDPSEKGSA